jgi:uncharacterized membrane protein (DUF485 family)
LGLIAAFLFSTLLISAACVIKAGTGIAIGGFIIGDVLPGAYVIQVNGNQEDFAQAELAIS